MTTKEEVIRFCLSLPNTYADQPFHDPNWTALRLRENSKVFAFVFGRNGTIWLNVKCEPQWADFWRKTYASVLPAYHMNKRHWNSIVLDGTVPEQALRDMLKESYRLVAPRRKNSQG